MRTLNEQLLSAVVLGGSGAEVEALLAKGADPNYHGHAGQTAVHRACRFGCLDQLQVLTRGGGSLASTDEDRETPLHLAAREGHVRIVEHLLALGVDNQQASDYGTPLDRAASAGHASAAAALLNAGVPVLIQNRWGRTPLHEACCHGHIEVARLLLRRGADVNAVDHYGNERTPLHEAVSPGDAAVAELLLLYGADPDHRNNWGATPLHMASRTGAFDVIEVLLRAGADPQAVDREGRKPEDEAAERKRTEVIRLLKADRPGPWVWHPPEAESEPGASPRGPALERYAKARELLQEALTGEGFLSEEQLEMRSQVLAEALQDLSFRYQPEGDRRVERNDEAKQVLSGGLPYESARAIAADVRVLPLKALLELGQVARQQDLHSRVQWMSPDDDPLLVLFVSHRWEHPSNPDPHGTQLQVLKRMAAMFLDVAAGLREPRDKRCERIPTLRTHGALQATYLAGSIADFLDAFQGSAAELRERLVTGVGIVYDFMSLPQSPRVGEEQTEFLDGMRNLRRLMSSSEMLVLRYPDDEFESRSWCELELWSGGSGSGSAFRTPVVLRVDKWGKELDIQNMGPPESYTSRSNYWRVTAALDSWEREERVTARGVARATQSNYSLAFSWNEKESATPLVARPDFRPHNEPNIPKTPKSFQFWHSVRSALCHGIEDADFAVLLKEHMAKHGIRCTGDRDLVTTALWLLGCHESKLDHAFIVFYGRCLLRYLVEGKDLEIALFYRQTNERVHFKFADGEESLE